MFTTKQKFTVDAQKMKRRKSKKNSVENNQFRKEDSQERKKGTKKLQNSQRTMNKMALCKSLPINNYIKCTEFSNQKAWIS